MATGSSCTPPGQGQDASPPTAAAAAPGETGLHLDDEFIGDLMNKAEAIGQAELERFASSIEVYKDVVGLHKSIVNPVDPSAGLWLKCYQTFDSFEVVDLVRTNSYLYPLEYVIRYTYSFYHTPMHHTTEKNEFLNIDPARLAEAETEYVKEGEHTFERRYLADRDAKPRADQFRFIVPHHFFHGMLLSEGNTQGLLFENTPSPILYGEEGKVTPGLVVPLAPNVPAAAAPGTLSGEIELTPENLEALRRRALEAGADQ